MQEEDSVNNNANDDECLMNLSERRDKNLFSPHLWLYNNNNNNISLPLKEFDHHQEFFVRG
jgi:hypothetical protein